MDMKINVGTKFMENTITRPEIDPGKIMVYNPDDFSPYDDDINLSVSRPGSLIHISIHKQDSNYNYRDFDEGI